MDYALGDGTAFDVFNELKGTPIILITRAETEEIVIKAMKAGVYDYRIKDSDRNYLKTLSLTIENAIRHKQEKDELQRYREHLKDLVQEHTVELTKANQMLRQEIVV